MAAKGSASVVPSALGGSVGGMAGSTASLSCTSGAGAAAPVVDAPATSATGACVLGGSTCRLPAGITSLLSRMADSLRTLTDRCSSYRLRRWRDGRWQVGSSSSSGDAWLHTVQCEQIQLSWLGRWRQRQRHRGGFSALRGGAAHASWAGTADACSWAGAACTNGRGARAGRQWCRAGAACTNGLGARAGRQRRTGAAATGHHAVGRLEPGLVALAPQRLAGAGISGRPLRRDVVSAGAGTWASAAATAACTGRGALFEFMRLNMAC